MGVIERRACRLQQVLHRSSWQVSLSPQSTPRGRRAQAYCLMRLAFGS